MIEYRDNKPLQIHRSRKDALKGHDTFSAYCRTLMENGHHYDAKLYIYKDDLPGIGFWPKDPDVVIGCIGEYAKYVVDETGTPRLKKLNEKQLKFIGYKLDVTTADALK